jgi:hypothetical protein
LQLKSKQPALVGNNPEFAQDTPLAAAHLRLIFGVCVIVPEQMQDAVHQQVRDLYIDVVAAFIGLALRQYRNHSASPLYISRDAEGRQPCRLS